MPYILIYTHIFLSMFIENDVKNISNRLENSKFDNLLKLFFSFEFSFLLLFLFAALRGNGDADYFNYINGVSKIKTIDNLLHPVNYPFEFGFRLLSYITNRINANPQLVIALMNLISFSMVYHFITKHSKNKSFSLMIFFPIVLLFDMHHSRSAIAISSGLIFFDSLEDKNYLKAFMFFIIGMIFHKSAIIMLTLVTVPIFKNLADKLDTKKLFTYSLIAIVLFAILVLFFNPLSLPVNLLNNSLTFSYYKKLSAYLANERWSYKFSIFDPRLILMFLIFILSISQFKKSENFMKKVIIIQFYSLMTILLFRHSTILVIRIYNFFNIFTIVLVPNILKSFDDDYLFYSIGLDDNNKLRLLLSRINAKVNVYCLTVVLAYVVYTLALITKQVDYVFYF